MNEVTIEAWRAGETQQALKEADNNDFASAADIDVVIRKYLSNARSKRRSRRLRKKLHIGEFIELGFEFKVDFKTKLSLSAEEALVDRFLSEVIEPGSLTLGGWIHVGFVARIGRRSASELDRDSVRSWLLARPEISAVRVGPLIDAWHSSDAVSS